MADEVVDSLTLASRFDPRGLDAISPAVIRAVKDAQQGLPPLEIINPAQLRAQLQARGADIATFFATVKDGLNALPAAAREAAQQSVRELETFFTATGRARTAFRDQETGRFVSRATVQAQGTIVPPANAAATAAALGRISTGFDAAGRSAAQATVGLRAWERGVAQVNASNAQLEASTLAIANAVQSRIVTAFNEAGAAGRRASEGNAAMARGIELASGATVASVRAFDSQHNSARRAATTLGLLAAQSVGATGPIGRLAEVALFASGGLGVLAAVSVTVLATAKAWEILTASELRAKDAHDKALESFKQRVEGFTTGQPETQRGTAREQLQDLGLKAQSIKLEEAVARATGDVLGILSARIRARINENEQTRLHRDLALDELRAEQAQLVAQRGLAAQATADAVALNRIRAQGLQAEAKAQHDLAAAVGQQTFGAKPGVLSNEDIEFFRQRLAITQATTAADVTALEVQRQLAQVDLAAAGQTKDQLTANRERVLALDQAIQARTLEGRQQAQAIRNEQAITAATRERIQLETDHAARVAAAGGGNLTQGLGALPPPPVQVPAFQQGVRLQGLESGEGDAIQQARRDMAALVRSTLEWNDALADSIKESERAFKREQVDRLRRAVDGLLGGLDSVTRAASGVGLIGEEAAAAIGSVLQLGDALEKVAESASTGNILGAIGAGIGLLGQAFGESPLEREHNDLLKQNNDRLAELKLGLDQAFQAGAGVKVSQDVLATQTVIHVSPTTGFHLSPEFQRALDDAGLSLTEFAALVKQQTGIEILDREGHLVAAAFIQARDAVDKFVEQITQFGTSASAIESRITTEEKLGLVPRSSDAGVAALQHDRDVQLEALRLSDAEEARIRALDLNTAEGRAEFLRTERDLFERAKAGKLTPEELGAFQNVDEFGASIGGAADDLNVFADAAKNATDRMQDFNLPAGFARQRLLFESSDFAPPQAQPNPNLRGTDLLPRTPVGGDGGALPVAQAVRSFSITIAAGAIVIHGVDDPGANADAVITAIRRKAMAQSGDTLQFGFN